MNHLAQALFEEEDLEQVADQTVRASAQLVGAESGSLYLVNEGELRLKAFTLVRLPTSTVRQPVVGSSDREVASAVIKTRRPLRQRRAMNEQAGIKSDVLAVPLVHGEGEVLGALVLRGSSNPGGFTATDEVVVDSLAVMVSAALHSRLQLLRERLVAAHLQRAVLPELRPIAGLSVDVVYESATDAGLVGGDFFDAAPLGGNRVYLAVGDVCGRGVRAATQMAMIRYTLRAMASLGLSAGRCLSLCNAVAVASGDIEDYATAVAAVLDLGTRTLDYAMAGHPPPVVALPDSAWSLGGTPGLPLGVILESEYETHRVVLPRGATLALYTDGLSEARRPGVSLFGEEKLLQELRVAAGDLAGAAARVVAAARKHAGGRLADDAVLLLVRLAEEKGTP